MLDNSQVSFNGSVHQLNRLSRKLSYGKIVTEVISNQFCHVPAKIGGELANFRKLKDGRFYVDLAKPAEIKKGRVLIEVSGIGTTKAGAARDFLNRIKNGVRLVTDACGFARAEYFVQQGKHGSEIKRLNTSV